MTNKRFTVRQGNKAFVRTDIDGCENSESLPVSNLTQIRYVVNRDKLQYDHSKFHEAMSVCVGACRSIINIKISRVVSWPRT
jgi:hypothetical protein